MAPTSTLPGGTCPLCQSQPGPPRATPSPHSPHSPQLDMGTCPHACLLSVVFSSVLLYLPFCIFSFCVSPVSLSVHLSVFVSDSWFLCLLLSGLYLYFSLLFCVIPVSLTPPLCCVSVSPLFLFACICLSGSVSFLFAFLCLCLTSVCLSLSVCVSVYVWLSLSFSVLPSVPLSISVFWSLPHRLPVTPMWLWPGPAPWY